MEKKIMFNHINLSVNLRFQTYPCLAHNHIHSWDEENKDVQCFRCHRCSFIQIMYVQKSTVKYISSKVFICLVKYEQLFDPLTVLQSFNQMSYNTNPRCSLQIKRAIVKLIWFFSLPQMLFLLILVAYELFIKKKNTFFPFCTLKPFRKSFLRSSVKTYWPSFINQS